MQCTLIAVGKRLPNWVYEGVRSYQKRFKEPWSFDIIEVDNADSKNANAAVIKQKEGARLLSQVKSRDWVIACEVNGKTYSSETLAQQCEQWQQQSKRCVFLIGGSEGLSADCLARADAKISLSSLTLPHALVRVFLAEQLYRAYTILNHHPYHRA